jgi:hypothetical protein
VKANPEFLKEKYHICYCRENILSRLRVSKQLHPHIDSINTETELPEKDGILKKANTGCFSESGDFATQFFSGSATLGRIPLSPFFCQL